MVRIGMVTTIQTNLPANLTPTEITLERPETVVMAATAKTADTAAMVVRAAMAVMVAWMVMHQSIHTHT